MSNIHAIGLAALIALCLSAPADARDRGVRVAPDLAEEWILQLTPGSGVVPGYIRPDLAHPRGAYDGVALQGGGYPERSGVSVRAPYRSRDIKDAPQPTDPAYTARSSPRPPPRPPAAR